MRLSGYNPRKHIFFRLLCSAQFYIGQNIEIAEFLSDIKSKGILFRNCICLKQIIIISRIMNELLKALRRDYRSFPGLQKPPGDFLPHCC